MPRIANVDLDERVAYKHQMIPSRAQIQALEAALDAAYCARPVLQYDANQALTLAANMVEMASSFPSGGLYSHLNHGLDCFAPHLVSGKAGHQPQAEALAADLLFGAQFHALRELFYYSYNAPGTIDWSVGENRFELRYADRSLPRQFFTAFNEFMVGSIRHFEDAPTADPLIAQLKGLPEFDYSDAHAALEAPLVAAADHKLAAYFTILGSDAPIDLGGYSYAQAFNIYRALMVKALYHRYHAVANGSYGCVHAPYDQLVADLDTDLGFGHATIEAVLADLIYDRAAVHGRTDPRYFSLFREGSDRRAVILSPAAFTLGEGIVQLLRVVAQRRPNLFLGNISNPLGAAFVARAARAFAAQGFTCRSEVSMRTIDPQLPDIDLLVISPEPTLGYVVLLCELKSPVPPLWAKDQLRALAPDSISKAFRQVQALRAFLGTSRGVEFLQSLLPEGDQPHLDVRLVALSQLIITSDNAGMFFEQEEVPIMSFRTVERLLNSCDGDVAFVLQGIREYNDKADQCYETPLAEIRLGDVEVAYEHVALKGLFDYPEHRWRSDGTRERVIQGFFDAGGHPLESVAGMIAVPVPGVDAVWIRQADEPDTSTGPQEAP